MGPALSRGLTPPHQLPPDLLQVIRTSIPSKYSPCRRRNHHGQSIFLTERLSRGKHLLRLNCPDIRLTLTRFAIDSPPLSVRLTRFFESAYVFLGLYFVSLFSV